MTSPLINTNNDKFKLSIGKIVLFNSILFLCVPVVLLTLEIVLRLTNYGVNSEPLIPSTIEKNVLVDNPAFPFKYHPALPSLETLNSFNSSVDHLENRIQIPKPDGLIRGIVIGESTPEGFPYFKGHAFGRQTEVLLNEALGKKKFEIINLAYSAMTSYYVRDIAGKLAQYQPDFVVIYVGHNEYYGTISQSTGGNHFSRLIFTTLREFRLFQWISTIIAPAIEKDPKLVLMSKRFNEKKFPQNTEVDSVVSKNYIDNLYNAINKLRSSNIRVYVFEPISNILSMPPFRGSSEDATGLIKNYSQAVSSKNLESCRSYYLQSQDFQKNSPPQADLLYLDAHYKYLLGNFDLNNFIIAKDADLVPFRARSNLIDSLKMNLIELNKNDKKIVFIPTSDLLIDRYGRKIFSRSFFMEHVHPNLEGHGILASLLAEKIALDYLPGVDIHARYFIIDKEKWKSSIGFSDVFEMNALKRMIELGNREPYTGMKIPMAVQWYERLNNLPLSKDLNFIDILKSDPGNNPLRAYLKYLEKYHLSIEMKNYTSQLSRLYAGTFPAIIN